MNIRNYPIYTLAGNRENGAALITALVVLIMLTLLAISTLSTSTMEERMAANTQELNRAFQVADTGLTRIFDNPDALNTVTTFTATDTIATGYTTTYNTAYRQAVPIGRTSNLAQMWEAGKYSKYFFELDSTSTTPANINTTLDGGAFQISKVN
jgi:Tfp pilus assembly protein PilX